MIRPFYIIAHRCNDLDEIDEALQAGANTIECDVRYGRCGWIPPFLGIDYDWYVDHDGIYPWSTKLSDWLDRAKQCADHYGQQFALIYFDIKTPMRLGKLRSRARSKLPADLNLLFSTADWDDRSAFDEIIGDLRYNEGVAIDEDNHPMRIQRYFADKKLVSNFWYGNGTVVWGHGPNVKPSVKKACRLRDSQRKIKKVCVWTLAKLTSILEYICCAHVDGVMINQSTIKDTVDMVGALEIVRRANRVDPAFSVALYSQINARKPKASPWLIPA